MSQLTIKISFKNDMDDIILYNWICNNKYKSAFVKSILREKMTTIEQKNKPTTNG